DEFVQLVTVYGVVRQAAEAGLGVEKDEPCDDAAASLQFDGDFMGDHAADRPAEEVIRAGRMIRLNSVGIDGRHIADRTWFGLLAVWGLLDSNDRAIEVTTESLIRPTDSAHGVKAEQRNAGAILQYLNGSYFSGRSG